MCNGASTALSSDAGGADGVGIGSAEASLEGWQAVNEKTKIMHISIAMILCIMVSPFFLNFIINPQIVQWESITLFAIILDKRLNGMIK